MRMRTIGWILWIGGIILLQTQIGMVGAIAATLMVGGMELLSESK